LKVVELEIITVRVWAVSVLMTVRVELSTDWTIYVFVLEVADVPKPVETPESISALLKYPPTAPTSTPSTKTTKSLPMDGGLLSRSLEPKRPDPRGSGATSVDIS
jgi:hypothetical protein